MGLVTAAHARLAICLPLRRGSPWRRPRRNGGWLPIVPPGSRPPPFSRR